ncbi:MAG: hypothetical protein WA208_02920 [Thermoanaerobaculia bacterium]
MAIVLDIGLSPQEIRILQEFRRASAETLPLETLIAIRHPYGDPDLPVRSLVSKGFLTQSETGFSLTGKATDLLAIDAKP